MLSVSSTALDQRTCQFNQDDDAVGEDDDDVDEDDYDDVNEDDGDYVGEDDDDANLYAEHKLDNS